MKKISYVIFAACCVVSIASADGIDASSLSTPLKKAYQSLGEMGLSIDKVGRKFISGKYAVAVPRSAIIEEEGKSYVVILDKGDPSMSDRLEVKLGSKSEKYVHTRNGVSSGDYVVVRKEPVIARTSPQTKPTVNAKPVTPTYQEPRGIARVEKPAPPRYYRAPSSSVRPAPTPAYNPPPVSQRSYTNRTRPRNYQPEPAPVAVYQPPVNYQPVDYGFTNRSTRYDSDNRGCSTCNEPEPEACAYSRGCEYDREPSESYSGCFGEQICRSFRNWFH